MVRSHRHPDAFTLVELLVVIGIIALLIAILLPSLAVARQQAQRVSCSAKLHEMMIAAQIHANDHKGFYPVAGVLPGIHPVDLGDPYSEKYSYMTDPTMPAALDQRFVAPITISLAAEMSYRNLLGITDNNALGAAETDPRGFIRNFLCPSQASDVSELPQMPMLYSASENEMGSDGNQWTVSDLYMEQQSYNFNEAVLGFGDVNTTGRLAGRVSQIRQPAKTVFAADGLMGSVDEHRYPYTVGSEMATFYNIQSVAPVTMADAFTGDPETSSSKAGDMENFDLNRHRGKINIAFCDGHVETRNISVSDLSSVYLLAP